MFRGGGIIRMLYWRWITLPADYSSAILEVFEDEETRMIVEVDDGC
jgi:hypothetical protein